MEDKPLKFCLKCKKQLKKESRYPVHDECLGEDYSEAEHQLKVK